MSTGQILSLFMQLAIVVVITANQPPQFKGLA